MARHVFFSFHYERDLWRANVVRKSDVVKAKDVEVGRYDHSLWETAKTKGASAIQSLIDDGLRGASVTVVLVGAETYLRPWCLYEIEKSHVDRMGLIGVRIHGVKDNHEKLGTAGPDPFAYAADRTPLGQPATLAGKYPVYDWVRDNGFRHIDTWIAKAATAAGR